MARFRRLREKQQGFTLIEMSVVMVIFGLAVTVITSAVIKTNSLVRDLSYTADSASEARLGLAQIDRQVRSGNVLYSPAAEPSSLGCTNLGTNAGTCMRIYTQSNGSEKCVQWQILSDPSNAGRYYLRSRSWSPTWQTDGLVTSWGTVARNLNLSSSAPFTLQGSSTAFGSRLLDVHLEAWDARRKATTNIDASLSGRNTSYGFDTNVCSPQP